MAQSNREWTCPECGTTIERHSTFQTEAAWNGQKEQHKRAECPVTRELEA